MMQAGGVAAPGAPPSTQQQRPVTPTAPSSSSSAATYLVQQQQQQQQQQQIQQQPQQLLPPLQQQRRCAEVCVELLFAEAVAAFSSGAAAARGGPAAAAALEAVGFRVGRQLAERYSRDRPRLGDPLDVVKFLCKDFWAAAFRKQVDNLRTNHRGIFVLQDHSFVWLARLALPRGGDSGGATAAAARQEALARAAAPYLHLPCGIIRGALTHLGLSCTVEADARALPSCSFTIKLLTTQR